MLSQLTFAQQISIGIDAAKFRPQGHDDKSRDWHWGWSKGVKYLHHFNLKGHFDLGTARPNFGGTKGLSSADKVNATISALSDCRDDLRDGDQSRDYFQGAIDSLKVFAKDCGIDLTA